MKKTAKKKRSLSEILGKKPSMQEVSKPTANRKKFEVSLVVEGDMLDKDTPISGESLAALFQLQFQSEKIIKILKVEAKEVQEPVVAAEPPINNG